MKYVRVAGRIVGWLIILAVLSATAYLFWVGVPRLFAEVAKLYGEATPQFKLGLITAVLSTAGVVWSVLYQRRKELESLQFERKREAYSAFFDLLFDFLKATDSDVDLTSDPAFKDRFRDLAKEMMIWGSPTTINAYNQFQANSSRPTDDVRTIFNRVETLLRHFRADLGHRDRRLKKFALTKLILKGDEHKTLDG